MDAQEDAVGMSWTVMLRNEVQGRAQAAGKGGSQDEWRAYHGSVAWILCMLAVVLFKRPKQVNRDRRSSSKSRETYRTCRTHTKRHIPLL